MKIETDIVIVGTGVAGLFCALNLPRDKKIYMITKSDLESSDSFLAQGGICVQRDEQDYDSYFEDTMKAGHYENRKESVDIMIRSSRQIIDNLVGYGVEFEQEQVPSPTGNPNADSQAAPRASPLLAAAVRGQNTVLSIPGKGRTQDPVFYTIKI